MATSTLRISRTLRAPRAAVYRAFFDPEAFARWYPPSGLVGRVHAMDARPGGRYRMEIATPDRSWALACGGVYLELVANERIVFTNVPETTDPDLAGEMRITIDLRDVAKGTLVEIVHEGIPRGGSRAPRGWEESLDKLARIVGTGAHHQEGIPMTTSSTTSRDGTTIAYETLGTGPPLLIVWGAMGARDSPFTKAMREELAKSFTVHDYDRRGRGESGDTQPYSVQKEIEDLRAMVQAAGGSPYVWATSSGAALALEAAAAGVPMRMLAAHEPPYMVGEHMAKFDKGYERKVTELIREGKRSEAVTLFMRVVGVPAPMVWVMRLMPFWKKMLPVAHTLPYDAACMNGFVAPEERLRGIKVPTVVLVGTSTPASLKAAAAEVTRLVPNATLRELPKQNHGVKPAALRPVLVEIFR